MEEENIEQLEDTPVMVSNTETTEKTTEKIEIVEHVESKYDNVVPRTEMGEMSKQEKAEIRSKVLGENPPNTNQTVGTEVNSVATNQEQLQKPNGNSLGKILAIILAVIVVLAGLYIFVIVPMGGM